MADGYRKLSEMNMHENQEIMTDDIYKIVRALATESEDLSQRKYEKKERLILEATDMTSEEKLNAMDRNYDRRQMEKDDNIIKYTGLVILFAGLLFVGPRAIRHLKF